MTSTLVVGPSSEKPKAVKEDWSGSLRVLAAFIHLKVASTSKSAHHSSTDFRYYNRMRITSDQSFEGIPVTFLVRCRPLTTALGKKSLPPATSFVFEA
jgi:hypothetical protein